MKPHPEQRPGELTWEHVLDLRAMRPTEQAHAAHNLTASGRFAGHRVTVRVGSLHPYSDRVDPRVAWFLADAFQSGVSLHFEGTPAAVSSWLQTLRELPPPPERPRSRRRLRVVNP